MIRKLLHAEIPRLSPDQVNKLARHPITVVVDNVRSLYNIGSVFRTSDAALIERIILTGISGSPDRREVHKTALGAQDTVPWEYESDTLTVINRLKGEGYTIAPLEITDTPTKVSALSLEHFPLCLVLGHEVFGVNDEVISESNLAIEIPQYGAKQSLNVSVAYGVAIFGLVDRWIQLNT